MTGPGNGRIGIDEKRERKTEERWARWEDRQRVERQGDEIVDMIRRHEEEEEEKRRQAEGMSAGDEYRMMLMMAEKHAHEVSEHREMVEEETQNGIKEAREKVVMEMEEMIEKGYGNVTFGSERIRPGEYIERKKGELEKNEVEKGLTAGDRVLSMHLAEANRDEEERRIRGKGKGRNMAEEMKGGEIAPMMSEMMVVSGHDATALKEMIVAAAVEEIDRGETMTQATVVETMIVAAARQNENVVAASDDMMTMTTDEAAGVRNDERDDIVAVVEEEMAVAVAAATELEDRRRCDNEADEQALLEQLLQGNGMEENCMREMKCVKRVCGGLYCASPGRGNGGGWERRWC